MALKKEGPKRKRAELIGLQVDIRRLLVEAWSCLLLYRAQLNEIAQRSTKRHGHAILPTQNDDCTWVLPALDNLKDQRQAWKEIRAAYKKYGVASEDKFWKPMAEAACLILEFGLFEEKK
jgi:hypothetical protein